MTTWRKQPIIFYRGVKSANSGWHTGAACPSNALGGITLNSRTSVYNDWCTREWVINLTKVRIRTRPSSFQLWSVWGFNYSQYTKTALCRTISSKRFTGIIMIWLELSLALEFDGYDVSYSNSDKAKECRVDLNLTVQIRFCRVFLQA